MYFITVTDSCGKRIEVEISKDVFKVFEDSRLQEISEEHERRDHIDKRGLDNIYVIREIDRRALSPEKHYQHRDLLKRVFSVINSCSPKQRERFVLHAIYGYKYREIAAFHGCSEKTVHMSVKKVRGKILNNL